MHPMLFIVILLVTVFGMYQILGGVMTIIFLGGDISKLEQKLTTTRIVLSFSQFMFLLFPVLIFSMLQGNKFKEVFRIKKPDLSVLLLSVFALIVIQPFLQVYLLIQNKLIFAIPFGTDIIRNLKTLFDSLESTTMNLVKANNIPEFIGVVFIIAVTPAICEEFLFRGLVFKNFEKISKPFNAIFFTGLLFALFHFHPFNLIPLILLGFFLTYVTYYSGSIFTAIICHFINNFVSALSVFILGKENFAEPNVSNTELMQYSVLGLISLIIFIALLISINKIYTNKLIKT